MWPYRVDTCQVLIWSRNAAAGDVVTKSKICRLKEDMRECLGGSADRWLIQQS